MKVGCRARGKGWGWRAKRSPEAPLLEVSYGRVEGWKPLCVSQCWLTSLSPALPTNTAHCPILPAAWDGQRLGPLHIPWRRVIRGRRSLRRGPRSWAHIFWGAAEMRWAQVQFHGTCEGKVGPADTMCCHRSLQTAASSGPSEPNRTCPLYRKGHWDPGKEACMCPEVVGLVLGIQMPVSLLQ